MATREIDVVAAVAVVQQDPPRRAFAPGDSVFAEWCAAEMVWLPEKGMGYLPVPRDEGVYDEGYFANYQQLAATPMGVAITKARVDLVRRYAGDGHVIDVGVGSGAFILARMGWTWGYDVNPVGVAWLKAQGRYLDPYSGIIGAIALWDVLEHLEEPARLLAHVREWVFLSLPIVPGEGPPPSTWRHYKPREHAWYWTRAGLERWMGAHGFALRHASDTETRLGRQDIGTFVFQRRSP